MFYLTTHSTHFIYGYMASGIWLRTIMIVRKETRCRHIGYSFRLAARVLLYAPSHRQDSTYHGLCYTSRGALAGTSNVGCTSTFDLRPDNLQVFRTRLFKALLISGLEFINKICIFMHIRITFTSSITCARKVTTGVPLDEIMP